CAASGDEQSAARTERVIGCQLYPDTLCNIYAQRSENICLPHTVCIKQRKVMRPYPCIVQGGRLPQRQWIPVVQLPEQWFRNNTLCREQASIIIALFQISGHVIQ